MSHFNLLEATVGFKGEEVLKIEGQLTRTLTAPYTNVLITNVENKDNIVPPCKKWDRYSLPEFTEKLYFSHFSLVNPLTYPDAKIKINIERVDSITD